MSIIAPAAAGSNDTLSPLQDSLKENQVLYNGRIWRDLYFKIVGDQFLFTIDFLPGTVSIGGDSFSNVPLRYDIYKDELITQTRHGIHLQLNKEMIDSFTLNYQNRRYSFERADSNLMYSGYVNKLYSGKSSFVVKYRKNVELMAVDKKFDEFYLVTRMFLVRENSIDQFSGRLEFLRLMGEHKKAVRSYMKKNNIAPSKNNPESFIPLIKYFDSLS